MRATETALFESIIFGPIKSRRLGISLGINLLPIASKLCNFDCVYCECGWTNLKEAPKVKFHNRDDVKQKLEEVLIQMQRENKELDCITFAGNGEPTMHPDFENIIDDTLKLRTNYFPMSKVAVLTNAVMLNNKHVVDALRRVDIRMLKLDAGTEEMFQKINQPIAKRNLKWVVDHLHYFKGDLMIQSMFLKGIHHGIEIDNTTDEEVAAWLKLIAEIKPKSVLIYSLDRATPEKNLEAIPKQKLLEIAEKVNQLGIFAQVT